MAMATVSIMLGIISRPSANEEVSACDPPTEYLSETASSQLRETSGHVRAARYGREGIATNSINRGALALNSLGALRATCLP